jgi:STE24 endopeptidase
MQGGCAAYSPRLRAALPRRPALNRMPQKGSMLRRWLAGTCAALFLAVCGAPFYPASSYAQETPTVRTSPPQQIETPPAQPQANTSNETDRYTLSHERYEKAVAYSRAGYALYFLSVFVGFVALLVVLRSGFAGRIRDFAQRKTENRFLQGLIFIPILVLILRFADLPVHIVWHGLSLHYQQSVEGWGAWLFDWSKVSLMFVVFYVIMGLLVFFAIRWSPRRWWFYFWLVALPFLLLMFFLEPVIIDPLFFKFAPLANSQPQLTADLVKLTHRAGLDIPRERMFLMNASAKTNELNAYVTGFGASKRVVIYDTLLKKMTPEETLFIFGHESGHYVLNHIRNGILFFSAMLLLALFLAYWLLNALLDRWGLKWKIYGPHDWAALTILLLLIDGMAFLSSPVVNGFSRIQEHNADVFGLELIHGIVPGSGQVAAHSFQAMGENDLADPNPPPFITFWLYTHPPLAERLVFAHAYDPWAKGQPPKYISDTTIKIH